ncbi:MAG: alkaline phosphatase D family protein [Planctomycetota bacterium]|nr:alkaline phosphatase D family protein [Planctomycetota bacterium]
MRPVYCDYGTQRVSRRAWLAGAATLVLPPWQAGQVDGVVRRRVRFAENPFQLGVASGDPTMDGVVLWTRLAPQPLSGGGMPPTRVEVGWQVARDEGFQQIVQEGTAIAAPQLGHSVHVEVAGLDPDRWYWYRFRAGNEESPVGRTRTLPAVETTPQALRFAFASCQHFETGYYTAYQHMAAENLDLIIHLGDYIYEGAGRANLIRQHTGLEITSLDDYRNRHALYKSDSDLQTAHASCPWLVTWDDHEFDNNYASQISEETGIDEVAFLARRANAYQAFYEHMPLRRSTVPRGPVMQIYRAVPFGRLATFFVLDTRQYRSNQPNGDGKKPLEGKVLDPQATMLGARQEGWLTAGLLRSETQWNVLAQQVMMARVDRLPGEGGHYSMDQWSGYDVPRKRLLRFLENRQIPNPVVLTGDIHTNYVNDLKVDFDRPESTTVATEFVGTSISSSGDGMVKADYTDTMLAENPFVRFHNAERGYVSCTVTPDAWRADYQVVPFVTRRGAPLITRKSFVVSEGRPGAEVV